MTRFDPEAVRRLAAGVVVSWHQYKQSKKTVAQYQGEAYQKNGVFRRGNVAAWADLAGVDVARL